MKRFSILPAALLAVLAHSACAKAQEGLLRVHDDFVDAAAVSQLSATLSAQGDAADVRHGRFQQLVNVPASLYGRLLTAFAPENVTNGAIESTVVPARGARGDVASHQDRFAHSGGAADGTVGLVYLAGDGHLTFTHKETGEEKRVDVKPGRFLAWDNAAYTHTLVAGGAARTMLGPMAFKDGGFRAVGGYGLIYGQLVLKSCRLWAGRPFTATGNFFVTPTDPPRGPVPISLTIETALGAVTLTKFSLTPAVRPKPVLTVSGNIYNTSIPGEELVPLKDYRAKFTFRTSKDIPSDTPIRITLRVGDLVDVIDGGFWDYGSN